MTQHDEYDLIPNRPTARPPAGLQGRPPAPGAGGYAPGETGGYAPGETGGYAPGEAGGGGPGSGYGSAESAGGGTGGPGGGYGGNDGGAGGGDMDPGAGRPRRNWFWIVTLLVVAFLSFAVGAALFTLRDRLGSGATPTPAFAQATPRGTPAWLGTVVAIATGDSAKVTLAPGTPGTGTPGPGTPAGGTPTPRPTITLLPTVTPTAVPAPCALEPSGSFSSLYRREVFGCPVAGSQVVWAAWEPFERGSMLWRSDDNRSYLFTLGGQWQVIDASWEGQGTPSRGDVPPGRVQPERGFGWVWGTDDSVFNSLGWATDVEKGFCAEVQEFEQGFMLQSSSVPGCTPDNLYNHAAAGDWRPTLIAAHNSGVWSGALGGSTVVAIAPTRVMTVDGRDESHGVFQAFPAAGVQIDGSLSDWPDGWIPIQTPVEGSQNYGGAPDASGRFQAGWTAQGLQLAVQVYDDRFRPGPAGTDLWQGDALELQFDVDLAGDYSDANANGDDYQIGIGLNADGRSLQMYRWLPLAQEGVLPAIGSGVLLDGGYVIEVVIPWGYLGLGGMESGRSFGFNLSISDNDGDAPAQEAVISASPARTTYDNPSEWGTLVTMP